MVSPWCIRMLMSCRIRTGSLPGPGNVRDTFSRCMIVSTSFRILLLSFALCCLSLSHASARETNVILLFGDSLIAGYGLPEEDSVPTKLEVLLKKQLGDARVINGGVSGDTTAGGRSRLEWTLNRNRPRLVVLALGGNDVLRGIPYEVTRDNLAAMLNLLKQRNIPTILSEVRAPDSHGKIYGEKLGEVYKGLAKSYGIPLYPFLLTEVFENSEMMQIDGIHPNAKGAELIALKLSDYILAPDYISVWKSKQIHDTPR